MKKGEEKLSSERIFDGRVISVRRDSVRLPNGRESVREVVEHKNAVVLVAENERGELLLISQYRYPIGEEVIELPAGIVEEGEDHEAAARRELREETGYRPDKVEKIASVYSSPGFTDELFVVFYATDLHRDPLKADDDEFIDACFRPIEVVEKLVDSGELNDAKTLMGVLWWLKRKHQTR